MSPLNSILSLSALILSVTMVGGTYLFTKAEAADSVNVNLYVEGCNNNYVCEAVIGEDVNTCPLDCAPAPVSTSTPTSGGGGSGSRNITRNISGSFDIELGRVESTSNTIRIAWSTDVPINGSITWSSGTSFNLGSLQEIGYVREHSFFLTNLNSNTTYSFVLTAKDLDDNVVTRSLVVATDPEAFFTPSVKNATVIQQNNRALLIWENPSDTFEYVRIVKSENFFPSDEYDGEVIYEGSAQSFYDTEVIEGRRYFYSIFVKGQEGFSPGVLQNFTIKPKDDFFGERGAPVTIFGPIYDTTVITDLNGSPIDNLVRVYQNGSPVSKVNNIFLVQNRKDVVVTVDKSKHIPADSQVFLSYFRSGQSNRGLEYAMEFNKEQGKFITNLSVANLEENAPFIIFVKKNTEIKGYIGYFSATVTFELVTDEIIQKKWLFSDTISSLLLMIFSIFSLPFFLRFML